MQGFLDFDESFDSCITATLTSFLSNTTPSSVSVLPIPLALNCRTLNVLSSLCFRHMEQGLEMVAVVGLVAGSQVQSLFLRYCAAFKSPEHFSCTTSGAPVAYSSTSDVSGTYRAG